MLILDEIFSVNAFGTSKTNKFVLVFGSVSVESYCFQIFAVSDLNTTKKNMVFFGFRSEKEGKIEKGLRIKFRF